ncbi:MAG: hypothetical protein M3Y41_09855, partial [Pseudomonadota bacterium]|nr:hypothetical protein [Pseudomonadota bacterium]
ALIRALYGLSAYHCGGGELVTAHRVATQMLQLSQHQNNAPSSSVSNGMLGSCLHWLGEFVSAREHLEQALSLCLAEGHHSLVFIATGVDPRAVSLAYSALDLLILGYAEQALSRSEYALARSRQGQHPL